MTIHVLLTWSFQWSGLKSPLPDNVHMLTLEQWGGPTIRPSATQPFLVRFEHIYEKGENSALSQPVKILAKVTGIVKIIFLTTLT